MRHSSRPTRSGRQPPSTRPSGGSRRAADDPCKGGESGGQTMDVSDGEPPGLPALSWASTTIRHGLLATALTCGRSGTDRGRQTASQRITGGLVNSGNAAPPPPSTSGTLRRPTRGGCGGKTSDDPPFAGLAPGVAEPAQGPEVQRRAVALCPRGIPLGLCWPGSDGPAAPWPGAGGRPSIGCHGGFSLMISSSGLAGLADKSSTVAATARCCQLEHGSIRSCGEGRVVPSAAHRRQLGDGRSVRPHRVKGFQSATDQEERRGHLPDPHEEAPMAAEHYRLVAPGSLRATCPTTTRSWGECSWRSTAKRTC
jgi:hypothetical protein